MRSSVMAGQREGGRGGWVVDQAGTDQLPSVPEKQLKPLTREERHRLPRRPRVAPTNLSSQRPTSPYRSDRSVHLVRLPTPTCACSCAIGRQTSLQGAPPWASQS